MPSVAEFVSNYTEVDRPRIAFAWNGKHAQEFSDHNQHFRWEIARHCIEQPAQAPLLLLEDLFSADAQWSVEAWCAPHHFGDIAALFLVRGRTAVIESFVEGLYSSFDTFGACHHIQVPANVLRELIEEIDLRIQESTDQKHQERLVGAKELLNKLEQGSASKGWAMLSPGTPISNAKVVWPPWYIRVRQTLKRWLSCAAT